MSDNKPQFLLMGNLICREPRRSGVQTAVIMELPGGSSSGGGGAIYAGAVMGAIIGASIDG